MVFRVRFTIGGGHVHCRLFVAPASNMTFAKCGDFVVSRGPEFADLLRAAPGFEFVGDTPSDGVVRASALSDQESSHARRESQSGT